MAGELKEAQKDDEEEEKNAAVAASGRARKHDQDGRDDASEEEEEDEEPLLKYASLTKSLRAVYKNGDATSAFFVAGDKMASYLGTFAQEIRVLTPIVDHWDSQWQYCTHIPIIKPDTSSRCDQHVLSVPSLASIRTYRAHSASISSISISPFPPPLTPSKLAHSVRNEPARKRSPGPRGSPSVKSPQAKAVPNVPSNMIYIATSSIDGNVCIASLTDPKDNMLRNFGRPVQAVALSPSYKSDRSYLSGGLAGNLVLTTGGRTGTSSTSSTTGSAVAQASGWLGSMGLSANTGKDQILHSGEGALSTIKWSLSGDYVAWVNEQGIKIMRSNLNLESSEIDSAWKRISHIDHPNRPGWDEMAGIWKAHVEWIDEAGLESKADWESVDNGLKFPSRDSNGVRTKAEPTDRTEKLVVGWSGTIWIINVHRGARNASKEGTGKNLGRAEVVTM